MRKFFLLFFLFCLSLKNSAFAEGIPQETYFLYLLPAQTSVTINEEIKENSSSEAVHAFFKQQESEKLSIDKETSGVRVMSNGFQVDINAEASLSIDHVLTLQAGSIHVFNTPESTEKREIVVGKLNVSFQGADFLAYVSGDQTETVIKVISGNLEVSSPATEQKAQLEAQQATSTDTEGRLLIPFPTEVDPKKGWWTATEYQGAYEPLSIADAGDDQRVLENIAVTLDGSRSQFKTGDVFEWKLLKAPPDKSGNPIEKVAFNTINIVKPIFTPVIKGEYHFSLQITDQDGRKSNLSQVVIYVGIDYLEPVVVFPDVPADHPNNLAITYLYKKNVMKGSPDPETGKTLFRPGDTINRVEILKTIFENFAEDIPTQEELPDEIFLDVKKDHWFAPYVVLAKEKQIIKGNDGLYRPADNVLLVEAIKIIIEASDFSVEAFQNQTTAPYPDAELGAWYNPYLYFIKKHQLFDPDKEGNIRPGKALTRAEFAEIIYRIDNSNFQEKKGFISGKVINATTRKGIGDADIFIYKAITENGGGGQEPFLTKGTLYDKVPANEDGSFTVTLPVFTKFYLEAINNQNVSKNKVIVEVNEDQVKSVELQIEESQ